MGVAAAANPSLAPCRARWRRRAAIAGLALLVGAAPAAADGPARSPRIESCVSRDAVIVGARDRNTLLDDGDRAAVYEAMVRRYPLFARDGTQPTQILLWQRQGRDWLYVTLLENPDRPTEACFTATFTAAVFDTLTPALLRKYFRLPGADA